MIVSDGFGKTLSDQTLEAFWHSISHAKPLGVGLNCTLRPKSLEQHVFKLSTIIGKPIWVYPDADFPNKKGKYTQTADDFVEQIKNTKTCMCVRRLLWCHSWTYFKVDLSLNYRTNLLKLQMIISKPISLFLSGLESMKINRTEFYEIGEQTNVLKIKWILNTW